jgi:hypothetical protein
MTVTTISMISRMRALIPSFATIPGMLLTSLLQALTGMIYTERFILMMDFLAKRLSMENFPFSKVQIDFNL